MRARLIGDPRNGGEGPDSLSLFGVVFPKGEWVDVPASVAGKIGSNSHFEIDTDGDGEPGPTVDELREALTQRGVKFHHKAGPAKLMQLLAGSSQPEAEG